MALVSKKDLKNASKADLEKLAKDVATAIAGKAKQSLGDARKAAEKAAADFGFSLAELSGGTAKRGPGRPAKGAKPGRKPAKKAPAPAKYKNPADATQTWSGRGRQPAWFKDGVAAGNKPEDFAI
jgi:DNA-binding protein H-NS